MKEFIQLYWIETLFTTVISALTFFMRSLYKKLKNEQEERERKFQEECEEQLLIKEGVLAILHDSLYRTCQYFLQKGAISIQDLDNLEYMYKSYRKLGGNGVCEELYERCKRLNIVDFDLIRHNFDSD